MAGHFKIPATAVPSEFGSTLRSQSHQELQWPDALVKTQGPASSQCCVLLQLVSTALLEGTSGLSLRTKKISVVVGWPWDTFYQLGRRLGPFWSLGTTSGISASVSSGRPSCRPSENAPRTLSCKALGAQGRVWLTSLRDSGSR